MKKLFLFLAISTFLFSSCGSNNTETNHAADTDKKENGSDFLSSGPVYDKTKIDPAAPVVKLTLYAAGLTMADMRYEPSTLEVPEGSTVELTIESKTTDPSMPHNWILLRKGNLDRIVKKGTEAGKDHDFIPDDEDILVFGKLLAPGEKETITFPAPPKGEYQFVCTYPGHSEKMRGVFIVK